MYSMLLRFGTGPDRLLLLTSRLTRPDGMLLGNEPDSLFLFSSSDCKLSGSAVGTGPVMLFRLRSKAVRFDGMYLVSIVPSKLMFGHSILSTRPAAHVTPALEQQSVSIDIIRAGCTTSRFNPVARPITPTQSTM
eukprot:NODE_119_length_18895_cov_0.454990.p7 type:complete len:135 gc:universal NODE_119_length_18895_cov_0.454990:14834-15238(+)